MRIIRSRQRSLAQIALLVHLLLCPIVLPAEELLYPKLVVPQTVFDFGTVVEGAKVKHDYVVRNEGKADLSIQRVVASCGCTATTASQGTVPPGGEATITAEFDTAGFSGDKVKTIRLYTNDMDQPSMLFSLKGTILPDVVLNPKSLVFEDVVRGAGNSSEKEVSIETRAGSDISIESVKSFSSYIKVREVRTDGRRKTVAVSVSGKAPTGELRDRLVVNFKKGSEESVVNVPIRAEISGQLKLEPATLSFGVVEGSTPITRQARFDNRGDRKVNITGIESGDPAVKAHFKSIQDGKHYVIHVEVDPKKVKDDLRASIEVLTDSTDEPSLTLSVYGVAPAGL